VIQKSGQAVTVTHIVTGAYNPATGTVSSTSTVQSGFAVELAYSHSEIDGTLILRGDKKLLLSISGMTAVSVDDTCTVGGVVYLIKNVKPLSPGGIVLLYELQLRA
jgi:hypothetical protein